MPKRSRLAIQTTDHSASGQELNSIKPDYPDFQWRQTGRYFRPVFEWFENRNKVFLTSSLDCFVTNKIFL
jgi:hypothetical protein